MNLPDKKEPTISFTRKEWDEYNEKMYQIAKEAYEKGVRDTKEVWSHKFV